MRFSDERVDAVANTGGTYGEFISSVIKSEHSPLISGISFELAGYAFSRSSFESDEYTLCEVCQQDRQWLLRCPGNSANTVVCLTPLA